MQEDTVAKALREFRKEMRGGFERIDRRFDLVDQRFGKIDQRFEHVDRRFEQTDGKIDALGSVVDMIGVEQNRVIREIIEIKDDMKLFATKDDLHAAIAPITDILDGHSAILQRLDQERIVTDYRLTRLERPAGV